MEFKVDATLDTIGTLCPIPVYLTSKKMKDLPNGAILEVVSDDEGILSDMPAWCKATGNAVLKMNRSEREFRFYIQKGAQSPQ